MDTVYWWMIAAAALLAAGVVFFRKAGRPVPQILQPGNPLPEFKAVNEDGQTLHSADLRGSPVIMLFVRGNWCPFCSKQVANLTAHYKDIVDLGGKLVLVTPKPLETTRRVAEFFEVEFEFWLDENLSAIRKLGLLLENGVPADHRQEYGAETVWPTAMLIDADGIIRYTKLSKAIIDRPDPELILAELRKLVDR